jgi:hypothetical protein
MKKLLQLQNQFLEAIYTAENPTLLALIKEGKASKQELLGIYRGNLYGALVNALRLTYQKVCAIIGQEEFSELAREFIKKNKSRSGNLDDYGENFYDFLGQKNEFFLSDLSKLEWLKQKSYLAKDEQPIDVTALQNLAPEKFFDLKFTLSCSVFLLTSNYNLLGKSKQNQPQKRLIHFLIHRQGLNVQAQKISKNEFNFLNGIKDELSLYEIYQKHQIDVQNCLQKYLTNAAVSDFKV